MQLIICSLVFTAAALAAIFRSSEVDDQRGDPIPRVIRSCDRAPKSRRARLRTSASDLCVVSSGMYPKSEKKAHSNTGNDGASD